MAPCLARTTCEENALFHHVLPYEIGGIDKGFAFKRKATTRLCVVTRQ